MLNQVVLVGRLTRKVTINKSDSGRKVATISHAIPRSFKNSEGTYDTDFIKCRLWSAIADNCYEYCKKDDIGGIKGRIQSNKYEDEEKVMHYSVEVIAERVTFLSNKKTEAEEE